MVLTTVIATDKTGTITQNIMQVKRVVLGSEEMSVDEAIEKSGDGRNEGRVTRKVFRQADPHRCECGEYIAQWANQTIHRSLLINNCITSGNGSQPG